MSEKLTPRPSFKEQLEEKWAEGKFVCVGLDPDWWKLPPHLLKVAKHSRINNFHLRDNVLTKFLADIIDATADTAVAFKPNKAFYEYRKSFEGVLETMVGYIHAKYPTVPVIGDIKDADIGNTNKGYAEMAFDRYEFDAITTNPYFGQDTYQPFLRYPGKGLIVLCKTTNPGAGFYQDAPIVLEHYMRQQDINGTPLTQDEYRSLLGASEARTQRERELFGPSTVPLYWIIALRTAMIARENPNIGLVVGTTHPEAFLPVRYLTMDTPFLIPGIGTQGGDLEATLKYAKDSKGQGMIINSSSGIIFASKDEDFAEAAKAATLKLHQEITRLSKQ